MNLIIDIGNTRIKAAVFENDILLEVVIFDSDELFEKVDFLTNKYTIDKGIISSVKNISRNVLDQLNKKVSFLVLDSATKVPFKNLYRTPKTLGVDRIALVANAVQKFNKKNVLIIDAGTCITYDFVNEHKEYLGGAISLGIEMRYKALNKYTSKLPLLEKNIPINFIGKTTEENIYSGVNNGVLNEINGVIKQYERENSFLTLVLTGGDTYFLAKQLKSGIFANPNFVLEGLNTILIYNNKEC
ncbi:Type III pantothenate kinase [Polaribacter huanghezhanensis]|uniref:type III pantothenate kinase n=1 Tax=Polaribacter huanghezhanensis TaxID=1354726 RepID=UPI002649C1BA|nr:type III pantothenate kinase [Polaribacter huanghezhanensis]WKD86014.1 Type III pantothenate kinase [Polaribacter huanghezhanensis]